MACRPYDGPMAKSRSPGRTARAPAVPVAPPVPPHFDRYRAVEQAIYRSPIDLIEDLRARTIRRGDGSTGPMTFEEIAEILNALCARHAAQHDITPIVVSLEAVRRWWRQLRPDQPMRRSAKADAPVTLAELAQADPATAAQVREELGL